MFSNFKGGVMMKALFAFLVIGAGCFAFLGTSLNDTHLAVCKKKKKTVFFEVKCKKCKGKGCGGLL
jgi:hypothetical protein